MVKIPHGEYRTNGLQLKEVAIAIIVPVSTSTPTTTTVQPASASLYTKDVLTKLLYPVKELTYKNNVSVEYAPDPQV